MEIKDKNKKRFCVEANRNRINLGRTLFFDKLFTPKFSKVRWKSRIIAKTRINIK